MSDNNDGWQKVGGNTGEKTEAWNPEVEKQIFGIYVEKRMGVGPNNSNMYYVELPDGTKKGIWGSYTIDSRFENIQTGYEVKIVYLGKKVNPKTHRSFKDFEFFVRKPKAKTQPAPVTEEVNPDDIPF